MTQKKYLDYVCPRCGGRDFTQEASVSWNFAEQRWEVEGWVMGWCNSYLRDLDDADGFEVVDYSPGDNSQYPCGEFKWLDEVEVPQLTALARIAREKSS